MKIIDAIKKEKGQPFNIPNCSRNDLPKFFKEMGFKKGAEIGVYKGEFTKLFAKEGLEVYGIDPYSPYKDFDIIEDNRKKRQDFLYNYASKLLKPYDNAKIIRKTSMEALKDFEDESLDFVYIDGNHKFKYVAEDMCEWYKKIKKGGIVCGHDYIHPKRMRNREDTLQVKFVVDAFMEAYRIENWFVLGSKDGQEGEVRDRFRSWMFIKQ